MTKKQQRILILTDFYTPHWTGFAKAIDNIASYLEKFYPVTLLTVQHERDLARVEQHGNIRIIREPYLFRLSRVKYSVQTIFKLISLLQKNDIILLNSPCSNSIPFALLTKLFGKRLVIFHHADLLLPQGFTNKIVEKLFDISSFASFSLADRLSTYTLDYAKGSHVLSPFLKKFTPVILPMAALPKSKPVPKLAALAKKKLLLFGFAGRFVEEKGFDILFKAIPLIREKYPEAHFVFAGQKDMPYEDFFGKNATLFSGVKEHITFLGLLNAEELQTFYSTIEAIIIPSRLDCFSLVQAEAMLAGTPAIVTDVRGLRYLVKMTGFGYLFVSENHQDLAAKVIEFIKKRNEIQKRKELPKEVLDNDVNGKVLREILTGESVSSA
ncbi:MAG: glycosyltransferase family 4 protein [Patescibacteria group bacterium]